MNLEVIHGRPSSGKTRTLIDRLNSDERQHMLILLEAPSRYVTKLGLREHVTIIDNPEVTDAEIIDCCRNNAYAVLAIDYLQLVHEDRLDLIRLIRGLKNTSVETIIFTSQLRRNGGLNNLELIRAILNECPEIGEWSMRVLMAEIGS